MMKNYNEKSLKEKVAIATEKLRKRHLERNEYKESDVVLLTNWISKIIIKKTMLQKRETKKRNKASKN